MNRSVTNLWNMQQRPSGGDSGTSTPNVSAPGTPAATTATSVPATPAAQDTVDDKKSAKKRTKGGSGSGSSKRARGMIVNMDQNDGMIKQLFCS